MTDGVLNSICGFQSGLVPLVRLFSAFDQALRFPPVRIIATLRLALSKPEQVCLPANEILFLLVLEHPILLLW